MKAVGIRSFGGREKMEVLELPDPVPGPGEVLLRIEAAGVNPIDWKIREGLRKDRLPHEFPLVLGWDAAGVVEAVGSDDVPWRVGDEVFTYCRKDTVRDGAYAERLAIGADLVAPRPLSLDAVHAAAVPLAALTAWQALDALAVRSGETLLVHAAAGGVGAYAVQLARARGVTVLGTASTPRHPWLKELGCLEAIDYRARRIVPTVRGLVPAGVDAVLDAAGGEALHDNLDAIRDGGRLVTLVEQPEGEAFRARGLEASWIFAEPNGRQLAEIAGLIDEGRLRVHVERTYPLEEAARAHEHLEGRHVQGKLVLTVETGSVDAPPTEAARTR